MTIENSVLQINFPKLAERMILILDKHMTRKTTLEDLCSKESSVNGFYFESNFFNKINQLILVTYRCKSSKQSQGDMVIPISVVETCSSDVKSLNVGVLYALRSGHPVIDGVGVFNIGNCNMLVFIQTSVMNFSAHRKLLKIFAAPAITVPELKNTNHKSYFSYYKSLCNHENIMFLYVSPQKELEALSNMEDTILKETKLPKNKEIYIGVVSKHSSFLKTS